MFSFFRVCDNNPGIVENFSLFSFLFSSFFHFSFFIYIFSNHLQWTSITSAYLEARFNQKVIPAQRTNNLLCCPSVCVCVFVRLSV